MTVLERVYHTIAYGAGVLYFIHSMPVLAQEQQDVDAASADIIVTARRTEERLQDVPVAISIISQSQLANRSIVSGADLAISTPSLSVNNTIGSLTTSFSMRGFSQKIGSDPSVGVYFADAVSLRGGSNTQQTGNGAGPGSFFDLQNVQVLKGPQGTLFGRNSTGGAILLVPNKPTGRFEGYVEGSYGNYNMYRGQAVLNLPLGETARFRVGIDRMKRDGYVRNLLPTGPRDFNDVNYIAARASLAIDLTPNLENYTIASYLHSNTNGDMLHVFKSNLTDPGGGLLAILAQAQLARYGNANKFRTTLNTYDDVFTKAESWQIINTTTWRASDALTIKNIAMYGQLVNELKNPFFGQAFDISDANAILGTSYPVGTFVSFAGNVSLPGGKTAQQATFSNEFRLEGTSLNGALIWQAGGYFESSSPLGIDGAISGVLQANCPLRTLRCASPVPSATPGVAGASSNLITGDSRNRNIGIYAQGTYGLTDQLQLTIGGRYTWTRSSNNASTLSYFYPFSSGVALTPQDPLGYTCVIGAFPDCRLDLKQTSRKPTWTIGLDYKPNEDVLTYVKWSRGFRQGGVSAVRPVQFRTFDPETVDAYEVGLKTTWRGAVQGTFNIAAFYNRLSNQQTSFALTPKVSTVPQQGAIANAGKSRIYGAEVDLSLSPFEGFTLDVGYAYLNTKILSIEPPTFVDEFYSATAAAVSGDPLELAPRHKAAVTGSYTLPLDESAGRLTLSATYTYTSEQLYSYARRGPMSLTDGVGAVSGSSVSTERNLVDVALNWNHVAGSQFDLTVFGSNITNEEYENYVLDLLGPGGFQGYQVGQPRLYGARVRYNF